MDTTTHARILAAIDLHNGRLTTADALEVGIHKVTLKRASDEGLVDRLSHGVYGRPGDGTPPLIAAAAEAGKEAVLSYRGASTFYKLDAVEPVSFEWCVPHGRPTRSPMVHGRRRFDEMAVVEIGGVRVTTIEQTLVDIASFEHPDIVERAVESALRMKLTTDRALREFATVDAVSRQGAPRLRAVLLRRPVDSPPTGSDVETICLQRYRKRGVPDPVRQYAIVVDGVIIAIADFGWPPWPFVVEIDGFETHGTPSALENDLNRQNNISDTKIAFRRFGYRAVMYHPGYVCQATMRGLLDAKGL